MEVFYFNRSYGDTMFIPLGLAVEADDGTLTPLDASNLSISAPGISAGYLKTIPGAGVSFSTVDEIADISLADKASYTWLSFNITGEVQPRAPTTLKTREYRIRFNSTLTAEKTSIIKLVVMES